MPQRNQGAARRRELERIFHAAVAAVDPERLVAQHLIAGDPPRLRIGPRRSISLACRRIWLVAAGKAAPGMARAALAALGDRVAGGVVVAPRFALRALPGLRHLAAGRPLPDRRSLAAGHAVWRLLGGLNPQDLVLVLLSGGASSLMVLPARGLSLADKIAVNDLLLRERVPIAQMNVVRKHLSRLKGGGLVRRAGRARVVALLLSDVIGGSPSVIGSGPTAADPTTYATALQILSRHQLLGAVPSRVRRHLLRGRRGRIAETPKPGKHRRALNVVIGDNRLALAAAAAEARALGFSPTILTASLRGDTRRAARRFAAHLRTLCRGSERRRCVLVGGETTVAVRGRGRGGRNQEFALALVRELAAIGAVECLSAGSDGRDGPTDAAGAFVDDSTLDRARERDLRPEEFLARSDSYRFFAALGDLFRPGPTGTNVMDLKIALVRARSRRGK